jgi:hypothetical protein
MSVFTKGVVEGFMSSQTFARVPFSYFFQKTYIPHRMVPNRSRHWAELTGSATGEISLGLGIGDNRTSVFIVLAVHGFPEMVLSTLSFDHIS